jgi:hypothetical protein
MCRTPEFTGDIDSIARARSASQQCFARQHFAATHHVGDHLIKASQVAARQCNPVLGCKPQQSAIESVHPPVAQVLRKGERNKAEERLAAHGGQIGQAARQSFVANVGWCVGTEFEVSAFENEICCEDEIVFWFGAEDRTIVADASNQSFGLR